MSFDTMHSSMEAMDSYDGKRFQGKVVDNVDPLNLGRIKASVTNLYDPGNGELPWIGPEKFSPFGQGSSWGTFGSPAVGSDVEILLQNGDPHYPVYRSFQAFADNEFPSGGKSWGFRDPYGNVFKCLQDKTVQLRCSAGVTITISPSGDLSITASGDTSINSSGNVRVQSGGTMDFESSGNMSFTAPRVDWNES